jgi:hypothetical protein
MNDKESWRCMPGGFTGLHENKNVIFETFNAIHIDILSENGNPLQLKEGCIMNVSIKVGSQDLGDSTYFWELN